MTLPVLLGPRNARVPPIDGPWRHRVATALIVVIVAIAAVLVAVPSWGASTSGVSSWIVSDAGGIGPGAAIQVVTAIGGVVVEDLGVDGAIEANLTTTEASALKLLTGIEVTPNLSINVQSAIAPATSTRSPAAVFPEQTGATSLWSEGDNGQGVNVAVLDTGIDRLADFGNRLVAGTDLTGGGSPFTDGYGHGTFVAGLIASSGTSSGGAYMGEAPGAGLVSVKVAGPSGTTDLATVLEGVGWTMAHAAVDHIRVLNMSLGFVPFESSVLNPLDQAVQAAWDQGIVVVVSAGNAGPFNGTILSPGDDPQVITVGALDDLGQTNPALDAMASFSSVGPTDPDGTLKPDLVASGRSVVSLAAPGSTVYDNNPSARIGSSNFVGSGTSFSTAITSGAVALLLERHPSDTPDQVKAALLSSTTAGPVGNPFVDGHGALNIAAATARAGVGLVQPGGNVAATQSLATPLRIAGGDTISGSYRLSMSGSHAASAISFVDGELTIPVSCSSTGSQVGTIELSLTGGSYPVAANSAATVPSSGLLTSSTQGSTVSTAECGSEAMYASSDELGGLVTAIGSLDPVSVQFRLTDSTSGATGGWSTAALADPLEPVTLGGGVVLGTPWLTSSWNPGSWTGLTLGAPGPVPSGVSSLSWSGSAWNGSAWNGSAWNGSAWNGSAWNGSAWNGSAWNGSAWNGSAWNGSAWNGSAWNGSSWS